MTSSDVVEGFVLVDKEPAWTSHDVVAKVRGLLRVKKVGHAGTLDPMATGLLVLGLGRATRLLRFVQAAGKEYVARVMFGVATDSLDATGAVLSREPMPISERALTEAVDRFVGPIWQVPPMVSAVRLDGTRLYELAREGKDVLRDARQVIVDSIEVLDFAPSDYPEATIRVRCGSGTYVRTLADDIARALGGRAHLTELRRVRNGSLDVTAASTIDELATAVDHGTWRELLIAPADGLSDLPRFTVPPEMEKAVHNGVAISRASLGSLELVEGPVRFVGRDGRLLAVYGVESHRAAPEVVLV